MDKTELKNIQDNMGLTPDIVGSKFKKVGVEQQNINEVCIKIVKKFFLKRRVPQGFKWLFSEYRKLI